MQFNLKKPFVDIEGRPILDKEGKENLIGEYIAMRFYALSGTDLTKDEMIKYYRLATKIKENQEAVELTHEDIILIEEQMSKILTIGAYGQVYDLLEK